MTVPSWTYRAIVGLVLLGSMTGARAWGQVESPPLVVPASPVIEGTLVDDPLPPRGLLQQPRSAPSAESFTPVMLGDFIGPRINMFSDVKIAEGESPRPMSRAFYKFNYYHNLDKTRFDGPVERFKQVDLYRNTFGMEHTLFDDRVSVGLRVPFNTVDATDSDRSLRARDHGFTATDLGNVSAVVKALLWEDRASGSLLSGGVTLSVPTATSKQINPGMSTLTYIQPFVGYIAQRGNFFVQGFSSVTLPIAGVQSIVLFNDIGIGYFTYRNASGNALLTAVVPTLEVHVFTPLRTIDPTVNVFGVVDDLVLQDIVNVTLGTTFEFSNRATVGVGVAAPVTGPKPFDIEGLLQLNYRY